MNSTSRKLDDLMHGFLNDRIPPEEQKRLEKRFAEFEDRVVQGTSDPSARHAITRRGFHWAVAASAAAVAATTIPFWNWTAEPALAEVAATVKSRQWLHMVGTHPKGAKMHFWVSVPQGIHAMKAGETEYALFASQEKDACWSWRAPSNVIRRDAFRPLPGELGHLDTLLSAFASRETSLKVPGEDKILSQSQKLVKRDGNKRWQYTFTLKAMDEGHADTYVVVFEVDPETNLPTTWIRRSPDGTKELTFDIDYPETGPNDIYALGVPRSAEVTNVAR